MVTLNLAKYGFGSGYHTPTRFLCIRLAPIAFMVMSFSGAAMAQATAQPVQPPASTVPVPGELELAKMIWSTMAAVDHANQAGNYSVLRDLSAPGFQINYDAAKLTQIFASLRASGADLSNTLLLAPTYRAAPALVQPGVLRVLGSFGLRPNAINFDLYYQWVAGKWRLFGVSIAPIQIATQQPVGSSQQLQNSPSRPQAKPR